MVRAKRGKKPKPLVAQGPLRLDFGCGKNKRDGFVGVDRLGFPGVDQVVDLRTAPWPWADGSVDEAHASHFVEHLTAAERITFVNELYRVLKPGGQCQIIVPHWAASRAYGDLTHQWPPVTEFWFMYLSREWRAANAPHNDFYECDFGVTWGYTMRDDLVVRSQEFQQFAMSNYKEACQDLVAMFTKR